MPINNAPIRGYRDWDRIETWDTEVLFSDNNAVSVGQIFTPIMDVSRFAYLGGRDVCLNNSCSALVSWFADSGGTVLLGQRAFTLSVAVNQWAQYRLPNLGPFVQVSWSSFAAVTFTHSSRLIGTNRFHPLEFIPTLGQLCTVNNVAVGAGATDTRNFTDYYAGPIAISTNTPAGGGFANFIEFLDQTNVWQTINQRNLAATRDASFSVSAPGAMRSRTVNTTAGAGNYSLNVTHSQTGAL